MTIEDRFEEKAREYLKAEFGVLGSTYQIMAGFALAMVAEERAACADLLDEMAANDDRVYTLYDAIEAIRARK